MKPSTVSNSQILGQVSEVNAISKSLYDSNITKSSSVKIFFGCLLRGGGDDDRSAEKATDHLLLFKGEKSISLGAMLAGKGSPVDLATTQPLQRCIRPPASHLLPHTISNNSPRIILARVVQRVLSCTVTPGWICAWHCLCKPQPTPTVSTEQRPLTIAPSHSIPSNLYTSLSFQSRAQFCRQNSLESAVTCILQPTVSYKSGPHRFIIHRPISVFVKYRPLRLLLIKHKQNTIEYIIKSENKVRVSFII